MSLIQLLDPKIRLLDLNLRHGKIDSVLKLMKGVSSVKKILYPNGPSISLNERRETQILGSGPTPTKTKTWPPTGSSVTPF